MIVDTQILFGLRTTDDHHEEVVKLLEEHRGNLIVPSVASLELILVMQSQGKSLPEITAYLNIIDDIMVQYEMKEYEMAIADLVKSLELRQRHETLTFFDALIITTTMNHDTVLVGDDSVYEHVSGLIYRKLGEL